MIERSISKTVLNSIAENPAVAIVGARQTGKTTLAQNIAERLEKPVVYLDLEYPEDLAKLQNPAFYLESLKDYLVIIDEIQRMPELFPVLRSLIDRKREAARFLLLGSASPHLIRESSESLAGRITYLRLFPFHFPEIQDIESWRELLLRGGFPPSFLATNNSASLKWREDFIKTFLERELPALGLNQSSTTLRKLLLFVAQSQGQTLNLQNFSKSLGLTHPTISRYIEFLERSYVLFRLEPWFMNIKKRLVKSPKLYLADSGIYNSLMRIRDWEGLMDSLHAGNCWEGFVVNQTKAVLPEHFDIWYFRTQDGAEADLVITDQDKPLIVAEIKWTNAPNLARGFTNVTQYLNADHNYIITPSSDNYPVAPQTEVINFPSWMEMLSKLAP